MWQRQRLDLNLLFKTVGFAAAIFLLAPVIIVVISSVNSSEHLSFPPSGFSFRWYANLFGREEWRVPLISSLTYASFTSLLATSIGISAAYAWKTSLRNKKLWLAVFSYPLFVPPVVLGLGQYLTFSHVHLVDTGAAIVLAHVSITFPIAFLLGATSLKCRILRLESVALTLGASRWLAALSVTLPEMLATILTSLLLCFLTSFDEPVLSLFLTNQKARTLPRQLFDGLRYNLDPTATAVSGLAVGLCLIVITLVILIRPSSV